MNIRMQVTIPEDDHVRAQRRAADRGISLAEYLRSLVRRDLQDEPVDTPPIEDLFGIGDSGGADVATHKDAYVADAVAAAKTPRAGS